MAKSRENEIDLRQLSCITSRHRSTAGWSGSLKTCQSVAVSVARLLAGLPGTRSWQHVCNSPKGCRLCSRRHANGHSVRHKTQAFGPAELPGKGGQDMLKHRATSNSSTAAHSELWQLQRCRWLLCSLDRPPLGSLCPPAHWKGSAGKGHSWSNLEYLRQSTRD